MLSYKAHNRNPLVRDHISGSQGFVALSRWDCRPPRSREISSSDGVEAVGSSLVDVAVGVQDGETDL